MYIETQISLKGVGRVNEDIIGHYKNYYWVMDGVTDLFGNKLFESDSDAYILVQKINSLLPKCVNDNLSLSEILSDVLHVIELEVRDTIDKAKLESYELPTFTIILIREMGDGVIDYFILGDSTLIVEQTEILSDKRLNRFSLLDKEKLAQVTDENERLEILQATRKRLNHPDGYWVGSLDGEGLSHALTGQISIPKGKRVVLATDGYTDFFSTSDLLTNYFNEVTIEKQLRFIDSETMESHLNRFKKRDDLSLLILKRE